MHSFRFLRTGCCALLLALAGCSPKFDWREVRGDGYLVTLPAKPASLTRPIKLGGTTAMMTMTAAEVDGVTFAVGSAALADAAQATAALPAMQTALIKNINGTIAAEKPATAPVRQIDLDARGTPSGGTGQPFRLIGRLIAKDSRVYQIIVVGPEKSMNREAAETFLTSFKAG